MCLRLSSRCPQSFVTNEMQFSSIFVEILGSAWICDETLSLLCVTASQMSKNSQRNVKFVFTKKVSFIINEMQCINSHKAVCG